MHIQLEFKFCKSAVSKIKMYKYNFQKFVVLYNNASIIMINMDIYNTVSCNLIG